MKNQIQPLISIAITCYNAENSIHKAVLSALKQNWDNKEILVVDDCSDDRSVSVIKKMAKKYKAISVHVHKKNMGVAASRNSLIKMARGKYIAFFDDDDQSSPNRLIEQMKVILFYEKKFSSTLIACYASGYRFYENGYKFKINAIGSKNHPPRGLALVNYLLFNERQKKYYYGAGTPASTLFAQKNTFLSVGQFDENLRRVEDADFAIRLGLKNGFFVGTKRNVFSQFATVSADKNSDIVFKSELYLIEKYKNYLQKIDMYSYSKLWVKIRFFHFSNNKCLFFLNLILFIIKYPLVGSRHILRSLPARFSHEISIAK
jgi:glycosyltransferase involved in cell wall biosynthesis